MDASPICLNQGPASSSGVGPTANRTSDLSLCGTMLRQLSHISQGFILIFETGLSIKKTGFRGIFWWNALLAPQIWIKSPYKEPGAPEMQPSAPAITECDLWGETGSPLRLHELRLTRSGKTENPPACSLSHQESRVASGGVYLPHCPLRRFSRVCLLAYHTVLLRLFLPHQTATWKVVMESCSSVCPLQPWSGVQ